MIKAIVFDLWGTLFYEDIKPHPFVEFAKKIGRDMGYGYRNDEEYSYIKIFEKHFMLKQSEDIKTIIRNFLKELNINPTETLVNELFKTLKKIGPNQKPYHETMTVLKGLKEKNYKIGLISNTSYYGFKQLEQKINLNQFFDIIYNSFETKILKPDPRIFELILKKLKVNKKEVLMVGDSLKDDIKAAERIGIKAILVDRKNKYPNYKNRIISLKEIGNYI